MGLICKPQTVLYTTSQGRYFVTMKRHDHSYPAKIRVKEKNELTVLELVHEDGPGMGSKGIDCMAKTDAATIKGTCIRLNSEEI